MALPPEVIAILNRVRSRHGRPLLGPDGKAERPSRTLADSLPSEPNRVTLTRELIHAGNSAAGGWNKAQLACIGIAWNELSRPGWIDRNVGREVTADQYRRFLGLRRG
jgi:hypothetical protein